MVKYGGWVDELWRLELGWLDIQGFYLEHKKLLTINKTNELLHNHSPANKINCN